MIYHRLKILYIITRGDLGGAQKYVTDLVNNLDRTRFETAIVAGQEGEFLSRTITSRWLSNAIKPHFLFINDLLAVLELYFIFRKEKPNVIHLNSSKAGIIGTFAAALYKLSLHLYPKVIFTAHGWVFNPDNQLNWLSRKFYILLHRLAAKFQDSIINVSEYDRRLAIKHKIAPPEKLITIHNGLDLKRTIFLDKAAARRKLISLLPKSCTANPQEIWLGSIGRLVKEKDYTTLIRAAALTKNPLLKFFIIGSGYESHKLQKLLRIHQLQSKFFILENVAPPASLYIKAFDIFLLSSIKEGLPYTLLEAKAAGLPAIVTRVGGMPEITTPDDIVILPKVPEELARAINHLVKNIADRKPTNNILSIDKMIAKTTDLYLA